MEADNMLGVPCLVLLYSILYIVSVLTVTSQGRDYIIPILQSKNWVLERLSNLPSHLANK